MKCSKCGSTNIKTTESRGDDFKVYRRKKCLTCNNIIYTVELEDYNAKSKLNEIRRKRYPHK